MLTRKRTTQFSLSPPPHSTFLLCIVSCVNWSYPDHWPRRQSSRRSHQLEDTGFKDGLVKHKDGVRCCCRRKNKQCKRATTEKGARCARTYGRSCCHSSPAVCALILSATVHICSSKKYNSLKLPTKQTTHCPILCDLVVGVCVSVASCILFETWQH